MHPIQINAVYGLFVDFFLCLAGFRIDRFFPCIGAEQLVTYSVLRKWNAMGPAMAPNSTSGRAL